MGLDLVGPVASAGGPYVGQVGKRVQLDASASTDAGEGPSAYTWDLDGDGAFDDATGVTTVLPPLPPGTYPVAVQVSDGSRSCVDTAEVTVLTAGRGNGGSPPGRR